MSKKQKISGFDEKQVERVIEQATKLGLGLAIISKDALEKTIKNVSKKQNVSEKEAKQAVTNLVAASKRKEKELENKVKNALKKAKEKSPVITKKEADVLKAEITKLKEQLKKKKK